MKRQRHTQDAVAMAPLRLCVKALTASLTQGTRFSGADHAAQEPRPTKMLRPPASQPKAPYLDTSVN
jgi:hypothetical protein